LDARMNSQNWESPCFVDQCAAHTPNPSYLKSVRFVFSPQTAQGFSIYFDFRMVGSFVRLVRESVFVGDHKLLYEGKCFAAEWWHVPHQWTVVRNVDSVHARTQTHTYTKT
jgi:hypothetical protein